MVIFSFLLFLTLFRARPCTAAPQRLSLIFEPPSKEVYIGQEVFFQIRLIDRIGVKDIELLPAEWPNAEVFMLNKLSGQAVFEGVSYNVNTLYFSLVPKSAGKMSFPSFCLIVSAPTLVSGRDLPNSVKVVSKGKLKACSPPFSLVVKSLPSYSRPLFAASEVKLFDGIVPKVSSVQEGTPVKRSVLLAAKGTLPAFLPDFQIGEIKNSRIYNGKTERSLPSSETGMSAALRQTVVFVPQQVGELVLPEIKVPWLNTRTGQIETAIVPAYKLTVLPAPQTKAEEKEAPISPVQKDIRPSGLKLERLFSAVAFIFALLCLVSLRFLKRHLKQKKLIKAVEDACLKNDFEQITPAVLKWASAAFPDRFFHNLSDVRRLFQGRCDDFVKCLEEFEMFLYGTGRFAKHIPFAAESLSRNFSEAFLKAVQVKFEKKSKQTSKLPGLYPDGNG